MAGDEDSDLDIPDRVRREDVLRRPEVRRPEEVPPLAERVGGEVDRILADLDEEREVVRDRVRERDRDEASDEGAGERRLRMADRLRGEDGERVHDADRGDGGDQAEEVEAEMRDIGLRRRADDVTRLNLVQAV